MSLFPFETEQILHLRASRILSLSQKHRPWTQTSKISPPTIIICHLGQPFLFSFSLLALCLLRGLCHPVDIALSLLYNLNVVQKSEYIRVVFFPFLFLSLSFFQLFPSIFCENTLKRVTFLTCCLAHFFQPFLLLALSFSLSFFLLLFFHSLSLSLKVMRVSLSLTRFTIPSWKSAPSRKRGAQL